MGTKTASPPTLTKFDPIEIDYGRSVEEMVEAGKYGYTNPNLTSQNFPTEKSGKIKRVPVEVWYDRFIESEDAVADMKSRGLDPADEREGLAFGEKYPDEQKRYPIPCLGKVVQLGEYRLVLCLGRWGVGRVACLIVWGDWWRDNCRFLAFEQVSAL